MFQLLDHRTNIICTFIGAIPLCIAIIYVNVISQQTQHMFVININN